MNVLDLFAGPGGWDVGARALGLDPLGLEFDADACATREAAGLRTLRGDVATLRPEGFGPVDGLIASPPCQAWSVAGKGGAKVDLPLIERATEALAEGRDVRAEVAPRLTDPRSLLVVEPLRWALALRPRWIALEQVPPVVDYWRRVAAVLGAEGWSTWVGVVNAADYGVPQTRRRAVLLASRERRVGPPETTHGDPRKGIPLFGEAWVSMAEALGWGMDARPANTVTATNSEGGPRPLDGGSGARALLAREREAGRWVYANGTRKCASVVTADRPAPTVHFGARMNEVVWRMAANEQERAAVRDLDEPAPTLLAGNNGGPRWRTDDEQTVRVSLVEASILQGFPPDYPWQGSRTSQFRQVGNAVPPPLARHLLGAVV